MKNKSFIFLFVLVFMIVFSLSAVSADDLQSTDSGEVSGDVDVATANPWTTSGELTYEIPSDAREIVSADVYVNVYAGSAKNTYGANANVSLETVNGENQIASEELWIEDGSADGTIYTVNNHTTKCYSDYQMHYDVTDSLKGLNGSSITIKVNTFEMAEKSFDGRIKLIALVLAYNDGDQDTISYWIDTTQKWTKSNITTKFGTENIFDIVNADLTNIALSSADGVFKVNGELLGDPANHTSGNYYQYSNWNVTDKMKEESKTEILSMNSGTGTYASLKNVLTLLKVESKVISADVSFNTEYTSVSTCFAGTNNTLTVKTSSNKAGKYLVELIADGVVVNSTEVDLDGENATTLKLTDSTIRTIDETTLNGANNTQVAYVVSVKLNDTIVGFADKIVPVLFNGYLGKDMEYDAKYIEDVTYYRITGEVLPLVKPVSTYMAGSALNRTDIFSVPLNGNESFEKAFVYLAYNWDKTGPNGPVFNVTFNGNEVAPVKTYRDQGNLGKYGSYGYGLYVYDVTEFAKSGNNTLFISKEKGMTAVYPSALICLINDTASDEVFDVYLLDGADLLSNDYNNAGRIVASDSQVDVAPYKSASIMILAASAQKGEGNIIVNDKEYVDVWNGTGNSLEGAFFALDNLTNEISFVATGSTILALNQIVVTSPIMADVSLNTEYTSVPTCYAGTNNTLTVTVKVDTPGNYTVTLLADGVIVNVTEVALDGENATTLLLTDPTVRPVDETTVNGANNTDDVDYLVVVEFDDGVVTYANLTVPVLYNGNLGYDFEYGVAGFEPWSVYQITGDVVVDVKNSTTYLSAGVMNRTDVWTVNLAEGCELQDAFLFIPYNWFNPSLANETEEMFDLTFNGMDIVPVAYYRDQGNLGKYGRYGYGVLIYRVDNLINTSGDNTLVLNKKNATPAVYPSVLVYLYDAPGETIKEVSIVFGADLLANSSNVANRLVKSDSVIGMENTGFENATLYLLAAGAQKGEGNIVVNGKVFENVWSGSSSTTDLFAADITDVLAESNNISFVATGSTILALPQIIVADSGMVMSVDSIKTEYTSVPTCYAGTNNTLTVTVTNSKAGEFEFYLLANSRVVAELNVNLTNGTNTVYITDPTVRPLDNTTVNGANNGNVTYTVVMYHKDYPVWSEIKLPVLYNGYLGKDSEYDAIYIEDSSTYAVTGGIEVDTKDVSTYMSASALNRTDVFSIDLDENSSLVKAFVYIAYNWDKSGPNGPALNVTFNGNIISPKTTYRDQGNLGKYGSYGYGLYIYDVTEFAQAGNNTLFISKEKGMSAVYPSNFIYLYDTAESKLLTTVYMVNGADLLSNDYNNAGRIVKTDAIIPGDTVDVKNATLYVFAASAQKGEGDIVFNGIADVDVWKGTSNTFDTYVADITKTVDVLNEVEFVATGSTILALNQMIVIQSVIKDLPNITVEVPSDVKAGDDVKVNISIPDATGFVYVMADEVEFEIPLDQGTASIIMTNVTSGTHAVAVFYPGDDALLPGMELEFFTAEEPVIPLATKFTDIFVDEGLNISFVLKDDLGTPISQAQIAYAIDGNNYTTVTAADGSFVVPGKNAATIKVDYAGNETLLPSDISITLNVAPTQALISTQFNFTSVLMIKGYAVDTKAGEKGFEFITVLSDVNGNPLANKTVQLAVNSKVYDQVTNESGKVHYYFNMVRAGRYTMTYVFLGDGTYNSTLSSACVDLEQKPITIKASAKTYKATQKTKSYTVTISTIVGSSSDGKVHLSPKKISLKVNGKTYIGKTNSKGQVTFKITNLNKAGKYTAKISYDGDVTYKAATKSVILTIR